ncbi:glycosyltransferase [Geobacter sp.]|uniref:glycosyltransferase family protein n=1 Tax=Geobacter sp. TaxID=46610 RepID=UPI00262FDBDE|nr:glycosyltransferase [Geobacter sp.]
MRQTRAEVAAGRRGHETVRVIGETGEECYLHSLYDPVREAEAHAAKSLPFPTVVFLGTGLGYHIPLTLASNPHVERVVIVERYPELAARAAERITNQCIRVELVTGFESGRFPPLPEGLDAARLGMVTHPPSLHANPGWYAHFQVAVAVAGHECLPRSEGRKDGPLTVLVPFEAYYAQRECINGFESLGHRVVVLDLRGVEGEEVTPFREALLRERPDLVFSVNMRGLDRRGVVAGMLERLGIPLALWFVDSPEFILYGEAMPPPSACHVFIWDRSYIPAVASRGYRVSYLPLAADTTLAAAARVREEFRAPISFVGNSLASGFLARLAVKFPATSETAAFAERALERIIACRGDQLRLLDELLSEAAPLLPDDDARLFFRAFLLHSATSAYRARLLRSLLPLGLTFFGDPEGWQRVLGPGIRAFPDVNYFHETPAVYASAGINVNATSLQMPHTVNQRVFDVPLCNGFLLTDRQGALHELFAEDEVAVYDTVEEAAELARYYLDRSRLRDEIVRKAKGRVLAEHTYGRRMEVVARETFASASAGYGARP